MRNASTVALLLLAVTPLRAQPPDVVASVDVKPPNVTLSQWVRLTLTIEGPAPMRGAVEVPEQLLAPDANGDWRVRPIGETEITPLPNGRERWRRLYRLTPYPLREKEPPGVPRRVAFNPINVNRQPVAVPPVLVTVLLTGRKDDAPLPEPHAVTPVEDLPSITVPPPTAPGAWAAVALAAVLVVAGVFLVLWRRTRRAKPVPPAEWARAALAKLEASGAPGEAVAERVAAILRAFVERRFGIPATKLTTAELSVAAREGGWPVEEAHAIRALLDECDRAKFAGDAPDDDRCRRLIRATRDWIDDVSRPAGPR